MHTIHSFTLITGASSGIGRELARVFAAHGHSLILTARDEARLHALAEELASRHGVQTLVIPADLARPESPPALFDELQRRGATVDILVNNAGFSTFGLFHATDTQAILDLLQVNMTALTHLARLFLPGMVQRGRGRLLNVASTAAFEPGPYTAIYYASKAYVLSLSEALASELEGTGVTVTALCPGVTRTEFHQRAGIRNIPVQRLAVMEVEPVAQAGYEGLMRGKRVVVPGAFNQLVPLANRLLPRRWMAEIVKSLQRRRGM